MAGLDQGQEYPPLQIMAATYDFNKEEDVKLFLDNLGVEYRFGCYSEKKAETCHLLGDYLEVIKKDFLKAAKVYKSNCEDFKYGKSCYKYAEFKYLGKDSKKSVIEALEYYTKGCYLGYADACLNGGLMCVSNSKANQEVTKDYKKGMELLEESCTLKNAFSCHYLAGMYISGVRDYLIKNMGKAFEYSITACDLGNMHACANVSQMYRKGEGVAEDNKKSEEFKKRAIEMEDKIKNAKSVEFQQGTSIS